MIALVAASACFGVMAVLVRVVSHEMGTLEIAWARFAGSLVLLVLAARGQHLWPRRAALKSLVLRGGLGAVSILCYFAGVARAGAGLATLLHSSYPVFTALWGVVVLGQAVTRRIVAALALSAVGAGMVLHEQLGRGPTVSSGVALALAGGMLAGGAVLTASVLRRSESASLISVWFMAVGTLVTTPAVVDGLTLPSAGTAGALLGVIVTSAVGQWLLHHGLGFVSATAGSLAVATSVVTAATVEAVVLGVAPSAAVLGGGSLMVAAVALATPGGGADAPLAGRVAVR